jgi:O-antigen/teichoic acid export membrane protein
VNKMKKFINNLIAPGGTLSQRVVNSGFWVFFLRIFNQGFSLLRLIILAHILSPSDFGLMGIALLTMSILETFSETGFQQALIQKKEDIKLYLDSAWTVLILRGFVLFVILYFIAPYAAVFFNTPEAKPIIRVIGFSILFQVFTNIGITYFKKELEFNKEFIYQLTGTLADFIVAISAVLILRNVWALVLGLLAGNITRCFVSYLIHPYRPRLYFALEKVKELFGFGKWILGSSILIFLLGQGDDILVGKLLGVTMLGFYQLAYRISNMPATEITNVISQVTFPAYSKLQDDLPKLREAYLKVLQVTAFLSFPVAGLIFVLAPDFTRIFLGEKWMPMVPAMQVLCILGALRSIAAASGPIFLALGRPDFDTKISAAELALLAILIYPLTIKWGITGTAISISIVSCSFIFIILAIVIRLVKMEKIEILNLMQCISFPLLAIIPLFPVKMFILKPLMENDVSLFCVTILTGVFIYLISMLVLDRYSGYHAVANLKYTLKRIRA